MKFDQPHSLRQSMSWLHTWAGLLPGWLLFAIFLTGTLSFFRNEITFWMQPELHQANDKTINFSSALATLQREAPHASQWTLTLPSPRNPTLGLSWSQETGGQDAGNRRLETEHGAGRNMRQGISGEPGTRPVEAALPSSAESPSAGPPSAKSQSAGHGGQAAQQGGRNARLLLDPATGERLMPRETAGGNFLYRFHFELYGMERNAARWIVGVVTLLMLVALVSGVIVHRQIFRDFFTFRPGKGKRSWLDAHNLVGVAALPFHLVITFSGLVLLGVMLIPTALSGAYPEGGEAYRNDFRAQMQSARPRPALGVAAPLANPAALIARAEAQWQAPAGAVTIHHPGDRNAVIDVRQLRGASLAAGRTAAESLRFDGVSGQLLTPLKGAEPSAVQSVSNVLMMLHRGFFAATWPRWLLFLSGVAGCLLIATGLVLWVEARAKDNAAGSRAQRFGFRLAQILNVAAIAGLMVAVVAYFYANRLVLAALPERSGWEIGVFFGVWLLSLAHAALRPHRAAWVESLSCAGVLLAALPILDAVTGGAPLAQDGGLRLGFDLAALLVGLGLIHAARRVRHFVRKPARPEPVKNAVSSAPLAQLALEGEI